MASPGFPFRRPIPPEPYGDYLARKNKEKAMDRNLQTGDVLDAGGATVTGGMFINNYPTASIPEPTVRALMEHMNKIIADQSQHVKELQGLLKEATIEKEQARAEIDRLRELLNSIQGITERTYHGP